MGLKLTENFQEVIFNWVPYQKFTNLQNAALSLACFKTPEIAPTVESFLKRQALTGFLQNNCTKHRLKLPGRSASVLEKYFMIDVFSI